MKGRPQQTQTFRLITGNRSRRPAKTKISKLNLGIPDMPDYLNNRARSIWPIYIDIMRKRKTLTAEDGPVIAELCQAWAHVRSLEDDIEKNGRFQWVETSTGAEKRVSQPAAPLLIAAQKVLQHYLEQCGLTHLTRSKVDAIEEENGKKDPADEFFTSQS